MEDRAPERQHARGDDTVSTASLRAQAAQAPTASQPYPSAAPASAALFERALAVTPGGVNSPVRAFRAVGGTPRFMVSGHGPYLRDADGRDYVDLVCSWGPLILGHADPRVIEAVQGAAALGTTYGTATQGEVLLAEEIVARVDPVERIRFVTSGTEATMSALRLARAATGRTKVVKFAGCYHGHVDSLLVAAGSGVATFGLPDSPGVPAGTAAETIVVAYNDFDGLAAAFDAYGAEIACVITEAAPGNMGVVPPMPGFTAAIAAHCRASGALFVSDEVMTGFRVSRAGWYGLEGVRPDLMTFGKVMGGGFPAAAFGGRADLMAQLAPSGPVYQAGTLAGNPVATAAGLATLRGCDDAVYAHLDATATTLSTAVGEALTAANVPHRIQHAGSMFSVFFMTPGFASESVTDFAAAAQQDHAAYAAFFHAMLARGVYLPPSPYEAWFVSAAHDERAIGHVIAALPEAAAAAARPQHAP